MKCWSACAIIPGLQNGFEKKLGFLGFKKPLKTSKVQNFVFFRFFLFFVKFYINHIKFHILIIISEFYYILPKML